ncbi:hypothetical protein F5X98DRAFT_382069 [Xylaria grammica]|nr:hypothetical protein F5X98DRAFT_382069 [Xylaria grammica]
MLQPRLSPNELRKQSRMVLLAHHRSFKRARDSIKDADVRLARRLAGADFDPAAPPPGIRVPENWIRGSTYAIDLFLPDWRVQALLQLPAQDLMWYGGFFVLGPGGILGQLRRTRYGLLLPTLKESLIFVVIIVVAISGIYVTMWNPHCLPYTTVREAPTPPLVTSYTTATVEPSYILPPPPLVDRATAIACVVTAEWAQLEGKDPTFVSLYDLSRLGPQYRRMAAEEIQHDALERAFSAAINERGKVLETICKTGAPAKTNTTPTAISPLVLPSLTNTHHPAADNNDNSGNDKKCLCSGPEGRKLHKQYELTVKAAAFLLNPADRRRYDAEFQRRIEEDLRRRRLRLQHQSNNNTKEEERKSKGKGEQLWEFGTSWLTSGSNSSDNQQKDKDKNKDNSKAASLFETTCAGVL